jgi:hypothetical protein
MTGSSGTAPGLIIKQNHLVWRAMTDPLVARMATAFLFRSCANGAFVGLKIFFGPNLVLEEDI